MIPPHPLTNFERQTYYQNQPRFNGVYSRDNLHDKIKNGAYVINLVVYFHIGTHWIALYVKTSNGKTMILSKCAICGSKKSKFIKKQESKGLLSNRGIRY